MQVGSAHTPSTSYYCDEDKTKVLSAYLAAAGCGGGGGGGGVKRVTHQMFCEVQLKSNCQRSH